MTKENEELQGLNSELISDLEALKMVIHEY